MNAISWNVYGKIQNIYKNTGTISYTYDAAGKRVSKTAGGLTTYYVRDAQGNPIAVYDNAHNAINWKEQQLYGSSRLGMWKPNFPISGSTQYTTWDTIGNKQYELNNHLDNVLETISDKRLQHTTNGTAIDYYLADVSTAQDYYPFGMLMPGRQSSTANYRYGFNGKENDNEVKGNEAAVQIGDEFSIAIMGGPHSRFTQNAFAHASTDRLFQRIEFNPRFWAFTNTSEGNQMSQTFEELIAHEVGFHNMMGLEHQEDPTTHKAFYPTNETLESNVHGKIYPTEDNSKKLLEINISQRQNLIDRTEKLEGKSGGVNIKIDFNKKIN